MSWPVPLFKKGEINRAGDVLKNVHIVSADDYYQALEVLTNWRACHGYPINTFQATLRNRLKKIDPDAIVAQRLKRTPSIVSKLRRFEKMQLARMQDIGGLRAIVSTIDQVKELTNLYSNGKLTHELKNITNYIDKPKSSGYRGVHLIYKYHNPNQNEYDNLHLELQFRTKLQHSWATAVETMGTFLSSSLKSSEGDEKLLEFFSLAGSAFAHLELCPPLEEHVYMTREEVFRATIEEAQRLNIVENLRAFSKVVNDIPLRGSYTFYLIVLNIKISQVTVEFFSRENLSLANERYTQVESEIASGESEAEQVVLVSAGSVESLRRAYPNYFLDTHDFLHHLESLKSEL